MGLFSGPRPAERQWLPYPEIPPNSQVGTVGATFTSNRLDSAETAMRRVAIGSSVRLLVWLARSLPRDAFTGEGDSRREAPMPPFFRDPDGSGQGFGDWLGQVLYCALLRGNVVGRIIARDPAGRPSQVMLLHPDEVSVRELADGPEWRFRGKVVDRDEVWHRRVNPVPGQRLGMSVIAAHAVTILQGQAAAAFGLRWFLDGAHPSAILQNNDAKTVEQATASRVKAKFLAAVRGTREPVVMGSGWEYTPIQVNAQESQFLDTQRYTSADCARIFGPALAEILGYETGGSLTYANVEQRSIDLLKMTLNPWLSAVEEWMSADFMPAPREFKFNRGGLLEADLVTRYRAYEIGIRNQFLVPNEPRAHEDLPPLPGGDVPVTSPAPGPAPVEIQG